VSNSKDYKHFSTVTSIAILLFSQLHRSHHSFR